MYSLQVHIKHPFVYKEMFNRTQLHKTRKLNVHVVYCELSYLFFALRKVSESKITTRLVFEETFCCKKGAKASSRFEHNPSYGLFGRWLRIKPSWLYLYMKLSDFASIYMIWRDGAGSCLLSVIQSGQCFEVVMFEIKSSMLLI